MHFAEWARPRRQLDLSGAGSAVEAADLVARAVAGRPPTGLLEGGGVRDPLWAEPPTGADRPPPAPEWEPAASAGRRRPVAGLLTRS